VFDAEERAEMFATLRGEGVALADRSKLRRLASAAALQPVPDRAAKPGGQGQADPLAHRWRFLRTPIDFLLNLRAI
jgi:hypothetical protein